MKLEPVEPQQTHLSYQQLIQPPQSPISHTTQQTGYYQQQIQFKQEPIEYSPGYVTPTVQQQQSDQNQESSTLVNHLLKDNKVLNLLDKVAQTFRAPTQSMYQVSH